MFTTATSFPRYHARTDSLEVRLRRFFSETEKASPVPDEWLDICATIIRRMNDNKMDPTELIMSPSNRQISVRQVIRIFRLEHFLLRERL